MMVEPIDFDIEKDKRRLTASFGGAQTLHGGGGGGTSDGMGPWEQSIESRLGQLHSDGQQIRAALVGGFLFLLAAFGAGYVALAAKMDQSTDRLAAKIDTVLTQVGGVGERVAKLEGAAEAKPPAASAPKP